MMLRQDVEARITAAAENRDAGSPPGQIQDVYSPYVGNDPWGLP
jgi:hypothetical protein